jgi:spermidine synthase
MQKLFKQNHGNALLIFVVIFIEGFFSIAAEILTIRQLIPQAGSNVLVTSLIIGIFLLFLAFGYWYGSTYQSNFIKILKRNFLLSAAFLGIGLSYLVTDTFFATCSYYLKLPLLLTLSMYLLLIVAPLTYLLGQTIPITMNLVKKEKLVGATGGKVLFLSTVGSFFGSILTTLILINHLGVAWTITGNVILLLLLTVAFRELIPQKITTLFASAIILILTYTLNVSIEKNYFLTTNNYANYKVEKNFFYEKIGLGNLLQINKSFASFLSIENKAFPYIEFIKKIIFEDLNLQNKEILVLGAGGFTLSAAGTNNNHFTYIDIDPKIAKIVTGDFLKKINGDFIAEDARIYLRNTNVQYDVIVSDTYNNRLSIPEELLTVEHWSNLHRVLKNNGLAIFNIISRPFLDDPYSKHIDNTIRQVFRNCMVIPLHYYDNAVNVIYLCKKSKNENDNGIYSDNHNTATLDAL